MEAAEGEEAVAVTGTAEAVGVRADHRGRSTRDPGIAMTAVGATSR